MLGAWLKTYYGTQILSKKLKCCKIILNRAYVSYNEKNLHVWKAENEEQIFYVNFFDETKSH